MNILAMDMGKNKTLVCFYDSKNGNYKFHKVKTTPQQIHDLLVEYWSQRVVFEISSVSGWVYDICSTLEINTQVANPNTQAWRWKNVKNKNDKKDALKLAQQSAMNHLPAVHMPKPAVRQKRALIHYRQTLVARIVQIKNNIRAILDKQGYSMSAGKSGWTSKSIERALIDRFKKFSLILHPDKTRTISFSRKEPENAKRQGRKLYTFEFLGFTHFWFRTREGWYMLSHRTSAKRFRRACRAMNEWLRYARNWCKTKEWWLILASKLRGHYQYYGVSGNSRMLKMFYYQVMRMVHKWLNRRSQRNRWSWERFTEYLRHYALSLPHIVHKFY